MPLFYTHNINAACGLAVWHITEDEAFFRRHVTPQREVTHPHKRLQHLAGRYLLKVLDPSFPVDKILLDGRRPYLDNNTFHFSISHCGDYAAAIVSRNFRVGIDVELATEKVVRLEQKFLTETEQSIIRSAGFKSVLKGLTTAWSTKESMFKWYALGNVDFRKDMEIREVEINSNGIQLRGFFYKGMEQGLNIHSRYFDDLCLTWVVG